MQFECSILKRRQLSCTAMSSVVSVFPNRKKKLHTTRSWDFMGFSQEVQRTNVESNISLLGCLTLGSGPSPKALMMQDLVHHQANGRALAKSHPISLATSN